MEFSLLSNKKVFYYLDITLRIIIFLFFGSIVVLATYAPIIQHFHHYPAGEEIYSLFNPICHQYPTRSFWIYNLPFALCARCTSGYLGVTLSALFIHLEWKYLTRLLIGVLILILAIIDPMLQFNGIYESNNITRFLSGLLGGISVFLIIYPLTHFKVSK